MSEAYAPATLAASSNRVFSHTHPLPPPPPPPPPDVRPLITAAPIPNASLLVPLRCPQRDPSVSSAAIAYMAGKLRLAWLDSTAQQHLCAWLVGEAAAMRPTNTVPPPGTNAAGKAAAAAQAMAAAAAKVGLLQGGCVWRGRLQGGR